MPANPKPAHLRQRRNKRNEVGALELDTSQPIPAHNEEWLPNTIDEWDEYWSSDVSALIVRSGELPSVRRMFDYKDEHARAFSEFRKQRLSKGSTGQQKLSPYFDAMKSLERLILPLEDRFGLNSLSRLRLGAELRDEAKSLADLNAALERGDDDGDDNTAQVIINLPGLPDPR